MFSEQKKSGGIKKNQKQAFEINIIPSNLPEEEKIRKFQKWIRFFCFDEKIINDNEKI